MQHQTPASLARPEPKLAKANVQTRSFYSGQAQMIVVAWASITSAAAAATMHAGEKTKYIVVWNWIYVDWFGGVFFECFVR